MKRTSASWMTLAACLALATPALAGENDLVLSRLATFDPNEFGTTEMPCAPACGVVRPDVEGFQSLVTELGEVLAPRLVNPAETLGEAGYAVAFITSFSFAPTERDHWQRAIESGAPPSSFFTGHLQVRKGLPFSFELAGNLGYLAGSEMFTLGADLKWALVESVHYMFPDIAVRGSVNTVMGAPELSMVNAGWDVSMSKAIGLGGVVSLTPYVGYQNLYIIASSRLLNAYPQDPRPPQFDTANPRQQFSPEFVFEQHTTNVNRFFVGARLNVWIMSFALEGVLGQNVNQLNISGGVDF